MNRKVNLYLNGLEFITYVLSLAFMGLYLNSNIIVVSPLLFLIGAILGLTFIGIELFLLLIMNNKARIGYIAYILINVAFGVLINTKIPFGCFITFTTFSLAKDVLRVLLVDKLYVEEEYKYYAKVFNIEVKDFQKRVNKTFNRTKVVIPVGNITTPKRKTSKGYQKDLV